MSDVEIVLRLIWIAMRYRWSAWWTSYVVQLSKRDVEAVYEARDTLRKSFAPVDEDAMRQVDDWVADIEAARRRMVQRQLGKDI